jgi:hypothetical protein
MQDSNHVRDLRNEGTPREYRNGPIHGRARQLEELIVIGRDHLVDRQSREQGMSQGVVLCHERLLNRYLEFAQECAGRS